MTNSQPMSAGDRVGVMDLISDYWHRLDSGDIEGYLANFTPDGILDRPPRDTGIGVISGRDAIREFMGDQMATGMVGTSPARNRHFMGLPHIQGDSKQCSARTYLALFVRNDDGGVSLPVVGCYTDTCVKVDSRWLFKKRIIRYIIGSIGQLDSALEVR